jgi:SynChlorMet cassette radical SAM/SPASM protein ScmF
VKNLSIFPDGIPPLIQYYVYLTAGCNLACQHCWLSPVYQSKGGTGGHLDPSLFKLALEQGLPLGLRNVKLTGGEPLLHPDFLVFVDLLKENNIGLTIETNGTLLTADIVRYLKEKSTIQHIAVSIDGAQAETHDAFRGVRGSFDKAVNGLKMLVAEGFHPQVIMSIHRGNVDEIEELVQLSQGWGAGSVKFNLVQPTGRGESMAEHGRVLDIRRLVEIGRWVEGDLQKRVKFPLSYSWPIILFSLNRLLEPGSSSCAILNILGILPNGKMAMCGIGEEIPELTYGQLGKDEVAEVWRKNTVLKEIRQDLPENLEGVCGECLFKYQCMGSCVAENYFQTRRLTASYWFCQQAYDAGLLSKNRLSKKEIKAVKKPKPRSIM